MKIPSTLNVLGLTIRVRYARKGEMPEGTKGFWHTTGETTGEVVVRRDLPPVGQFIVVMHELLHVTDDMMIANGVTKRHVPHAWVEGGAFGLATLLIHLGAIKGITPAMWQEFMRTVESEPSTLP